MRLLLLLFLLWPYLTGMANPPDSIETHPLLQYKRRPSMKLIQKYYSSLPELSLPELPPKLKLAMAHWSQHELLGLFFNLNALFPQANFVFIGRDSEIFADFFEAIYLVYKLEHRVIRLGISSPLLSNSDHSLLALLRSHGLFFSSKHPKAPLIFVDTMKGPSGGRQLRRLFKILYQQAHPTTAVRVKTLQQLNLIGLNLSEEEANATHQEIRPQAVDPLASYQVLAAKRQQQQQAWIQYVPNKSSTDPWQHFWDQHLLLLPNIKLSSLFLHHLSYYTGQWHQPFHQLHPCQTRYQGHRLVYSCPGNVSSLEDRLKVLSAQKWLLELVERPSFKKIFAQYQQQYADLLDQCVFSASTQLSNYLPYLEDKLLPPESWPEEFRQRPDHLYPHQTLWPLLYSKSRPKKIWHRLKHLKQNLRFGH